MRLVAPHSFCRKYPISVYQVKRFTTGLLQALKYMHGLTPPVVHRDLKCANVFVDGCVHTHLTMARLLPAHPLCLAPRVAAQSEGDGEGGGLWLVHSNEGQGPHGFRGCVGACVVVLWCCGEGHFA